MDDSDFMPSQINRAGRASDASGTLRTFPTGNARPRRYGGTGLGLSIASRLVSNDGEHISVERFRAHTLRPRC